MFHVTKISKKLQIVNIKENKQNLMLVRFSESLFSHHEDQRAHIKINLINFMHTDMLLPYRKKQKFFSICNTM